MMRDLHTHILPSLDDGAMDDEMTLTCFGLHKMMI